MNRWAEYSPSIPRVERWLKQCRHGAWVYWQWIRTGHRPPAFLAWPEMPSRRSAVFKIVRHLGWELTNLPRKKVEGGLFFLDQTDKSFNLDKMPVGLSSFWWNTGCTDIGKKKLEDHHLKSFGYGMSVNPMKHSGSMVVKSNLNARHDGRIVQGPLKAEDVDSESVYQIDIDNRDWDGQYFDYRVVWIGQEIPLVYRKYKSEQSRFTNKTTRCELADESNLFSSFEVRSMQKLLVDMGADYAELDVLRDRTTRKLYVVDINPTPWGPPSGLSPLETKLAIERMAVTFVRQARESNKKARNAS